MSMFNKIAIVGLGLIGSSIFHASRRKQLGKELAGYDIKRDVRDRAKALGFADIIFDDLASCVKGADLIIMCTPVGAFKSVAEHIVPNLAKGAILSDVGSVKGAIMRDVGPLVPADVNFIPGHPIAGTEFSGPDAGFETLFDGRWTILTPPKGANAKAVDKLKTFWEALGSQVDIMDANHHDLVLAITSHIPHLIAYNIVGTAYDLQTVTKGEVIKYSASGFRDFTRIAASDPTMWRDIFLTNKEAVLEVLKHFDEDLRSLKRAVQSGDGKVLFKTFTRTRVIRREIVGIGQDTAKADFGRVETKVPRRATKLQWKVGSIVTTAHSKKIIGKAKKRTSKKVNPLASKRQGRHTTTSSSKH